MAINKHPEGAHRVQNVLQNLLIGQSGKGLG